MFVKPDKELWNHVVEVKHCEVLDNLVTKTKDMLANFCKQQPREKGVYSIQIITVNDN